MTVQISLLQSGEQIISNVKEVREAETEDILALLFENPYKIIIVDQLPSEVEMSAEQTTETMPKIFFQKWLPLSKERTIPLSQSYVVSSYEPHDGILEHYTMLIGDSDEN
jgi:hypothetical protein